MKRLSSKKIKTKIQAQKLLDELIEYLNLLINFSTKREINFLSFAIRQLYAMKNSIDRSDNQFFDSFFLDKTKDEVIEWIESEAKKW